MSISNLRSKSPRHLAIERALNRLSGAHPASLQIADDLGKYNAGYRGECYIDTLTKPFQSDSFLTLRDLTIPAFNFETIQLDQLHITPSFLLLIECKNMIGTLTFNPQASSLKREIDDRSRYFNDPIWQADRHLEGIRDFLSQRGIIIPVYSLIVFTNSNVSFEHVGNHHKIYNRICRSEQLTYKIRTLLNENPKQILSQQEMQDLQTSLLDKTVIPKWHDLNKQYGLQPSDFKKGIICPTCNQISINKIKFSWQCNKCDHKSTHLSKEQLADYFLLIKPTATLKDLMDFYQVDKPLALRTSLQKAQIPGKGKTRNKEYNSWLHKM